CAPGGRSGLLLPGRSSSGALFPALLTCLPLAPALARAAGIELEGGSPHLLVLLLLGRGEDRQDLRVDLLLDLLHLFHPLGGGAALSRVPRFLGELPPLVLPPLDRLADLGDLLGAQLQLLGDGLVLEGLRTPQLEGDLV